MSKIDIAYLATVLFAFIAFAAVLAYYSQTCAKPTTSKQSEPAAPKQKEPAGQRLRVAAAH